MSRFDYKDPGTDPAYCDPLRAEDDLDVPDFDALATFDVHEPPPDQPLQLIDPAEHAAHAYIDALTTLEQQIVLAPSLERLNALRQLTKRAEQHATLVHNKCADAIDRAMERIR